MVAAIDLKPHARGRSRPGLAVPLAAAGLVTVTTPQLGSRACQRYTPPPWRRCVAAIAAYLTRSQLHLSQRI